MRNNRSIYHEFVDYNTAQINPDNDYIIPLFIFSTHCNNMQDYTFNMRYYHLFHISMHFHMFTQIYFTNVDQTFFDLEHASQSHP